MENWRNVKTTASGQEYIEARELSSGPRSSCRAIFFGILIIRQIRKLSH